MHLAAHSLFTECVLHVKLRPQSYIQGYKTVIRGTHCQSPCISLRSYLNYPYFTCFGPPEKARSTKEPFRTKNRQIFVSWGSHGLHSRTYFWSNSSNTNLTLPIKVRQSPGKSKVFTPQPRQNAIFGIFSTFWTSELSLGPSGAKIRGPEGLNLVCPPSTTTWLGV